MSEGDNFNIDDTSEITMRVVNTLSENGLAIEEYELHRFVDPDALAQLLDSIEDPFHISFFVKDRKVIVTEVGVSVQQNQALN